MPDIVFTKHHAFNGAFNFSGFSSYHATEKTNHAISDGCSSGGASIQNSSFTKKYVDLLCNDVEMQDNSTSSFQQCRDIASMFDPLNEPVSCQSTQKLRRDFADIRLSTASSGSSTSVGEGSKSSGSFNGGASAFTSEIRPPIDGQGGRMRQLDLPDQMMRSKSGLSEQSDEPMDDKV